MGSSDVTQQQIWEDGDATEMAHVQANGADVTQSVVATIARKIYDISLGTLISADAITVATSVFDTLKTDGRWTVDDEGYNFRDRVPATMFATPKHQYRVEYLFTGSSTPAEKYWLVFQHYVQEIRST